MRGVARIGAVVLGCAGVLACSRAPLSSDEGTGEGTTSDGSPHGDGSTSSSGGTSGGGSSNSGGSSSSGGEGTSGSDTGGSSTGTTDTGGSSTGTTDTGGSSTDTTDTGGGSGLECDLWLQDCPEGEKCMPWANDGGSVWNATKCSPLDPSPMKPCETCTVEGSAVSGIDNCDATSMCWDVDPQTLEGVCVAFCESTPQSPTCDDPNTSCVIANDGVLILCLFACDPLLQDCPDGLGCYLINDGIRCAPDGSGPDAGGAGDPCEYINACDPGLVCIDAPLVPGCAGAIGCCASFCDVDVPDCDVGAGEECMPWWGQGQPPATCYPLEHVGICSLPP